MAKQRISTWGIRIAKTLGYLLVAYLGLLLLASLALQVFRPALVRKVVAVLDKQVQGRLVMADVDLSLWKYFPRVGVEVKQVAILDSVYKQPFLRADLLAFRVGWWELFGKELTVQSISASGVTINSIVDANGYANAYVIRPMRKELPVQENPGKARQLVLSDVRLKDVRFFSRHVVKQKNFALHLRSGHLRINPSNEQTWKIDFEQDLLIGRLGFNMARGAWAKNKRLEAHWKALYYPQQSKLIVQETPVRIGNHPYEISGVFNLNDSGFFSLKINTEKLAYAEGVSLLADNIQRKLSKVNLQQTLHVDAVIEGGLAYKSDPKVRVNFSALPGKIVTPVAVLDSVAFYGHYFNERIAGMGHKDDNSELVLQKFSGKWGPVLLHGDSVVMTNLKDPNLRFHFTSLVDLARLDDQLALNTLRINGGTANLDLVYDGPLLVNADALGQMTAKMQVRNGSATYLPRAVQIEQINGNLILAYNRLELNNLTTVVNNNQLRVNVLGRQVGNMVDSRAAGKSRIDIELFSPRIDLQTLSGLLAKRQGARQARKRQNPTNYPLKQIDEILEKGSLALHLRVNELLNNRLKATNIRGEVLFVEDDLQLKKLSFNAADGSFLLDAELKRRADANLDLTAHTNITKVNVAKLFYAFENFGQTGITHQNLEGVFTTKSSLKAVLSQGGKLLPQTVDGRLDFALENGALKNHEGIQNIKKFIFKKRDLSNIQFAAIRNQMLIRNDTVYLPRMEVNSSALLMFVEGKYGLKGGTDLSVQLPLSNLKNKEDSFDEEDNIGTDAKVGPSVWFRARQREDGSFKFGLDAFKKLRKKEEIPTAEAKPDSSAAKPGGR